MHRSFLGRTQTSSCHEGLFFLCGWPESPQYFPPTCFINLARWEDWSWHTSLRVTEAPVPPSCSSKARATPGAPRTFRELGHLLGNEELQGTKSEPFMNKGFSGKHTPSGPYIVLAFALLQRFLFPPIINYLHARGEKPQNIQESEKQTPFCLKNLFIEV